VDTADTPAAEFNSYTRISGYDAYRGFLVWQTDSRGYTTYYEYDALGRVEKIVLPDDDDALSWNPAASANPSYRTNNPERNIAYDDTSLTVTVKSNWNSSEVYTYDNLGRLEEIKKTWYERKYPSIYPHPYGAWGFEGILTFQGRSGFHCSRLVISGTCSNTYARYQ